MKQLTHSPFDHREHYSQDERRISFSSDRGEGYGIYAVDRNSGAVELLVDTTAKETEPAWLPDGRSIAFVTNKSSLVVVDQLGRRNTVASVHNSGNIFNPRSPSWSPHGDCTYMVVDNSTVQLRRPRGILVQGEDVFPLRASWLPTGECVYTSGGKIRRLQLETAHFFRY